MAWLPWGGAASGMWWIYRQSKKSFWILFCFAAPLNFRQRGSTQRICERIKIRKSESDLGGVRIKNKVLYVALAHGQTENYSRNPKRTVSQVGGTPLDLLNASYLLSWVLPSSSTMKQHRLWGLGILLDFIFLNLLDGRGFQFRISFLSY